MDRDTARLRLADMVSASTPPVLDDNALDTALEAAKVVDPTGRAPIDDGYVETFDLNYAAAEAFEAKAIRAAATDTGGLESFTSEGSAFKRRAGTGYAGFMALADQFRARSCVGSGGMITVISMDPYGGSVPRSAGVRRAD